MNLLWEFEMVPVLRKNPTSKRSIEVSPKKSPDLRIKRLGVAIMKSMDLKLYFFSPSKMPLACTYVDIKHNYFGDVNDVINFLDSLYFRNTEKFRQFFEYVLNEILEEKEPLILNRSELFDGFLRFLQELNTLGYDYDVNKQKVIPTVGHTKEDMEIETELESMLGRINSEYPEMLRGAWSAFLSESPDKYRQTTTSLRELIRKVLDQLAPEEGTRRDRVKKIIRSRTEAELVDAVADTVDKLYKLQSKLHEKLDYESTLFALKTTEYLLYFLLKRAKAMKRI